MTDQITLKEYTEARLQALAMAVEKQESAYDARFESVNEWRQTYGDLANRAVSKDVFSSKVSELERRLSAIEQKQSNYDGRTLGYSAGVGLVVLIISIVAQLANFGS